MYALLPILALAERKRLVLHPTGPTDIACTKPLTQQQQSRPAEDVVAEPVEMVAALSAGRHPTSVCMLRVAENGISPATLRPFETYKGTCKSILDNPQSTPFTSIFADGRKFVTRDHLFPYDDVFASWIL